jgi:hypothetical protein
MKNFCFQFYYNDKITIGIKNVNENEYDYVYEYEINL